MRDGVRWLQGFDILVSPECEDAYKELREYSWQTDRLTGLVKPDLPPVKLNDHYIDCLRYGLQDLAPGEFEEISEYEKFRRNRGGVYRLPMFRPPYDNPYRF